MKFKLDENLPISSTAILTSAGHDVDTVTQEGLIGAPDRDVVTAATAAGRITMSTFASRRNRSNNVLPGRPQPGLDDHAQLDATGGWHQPDEGIFKMGGKFFAARLGEDDRYGRRRIDDKAPRHRLCQRGRPVPS